MKAKTKEKEEAKEPRFDDASIRLFDMEMSDEKLAVLVYKEMMQRQKDAIGTGLTMRDLAPIMSEKYLGAGVYETVRLHFGWITHLFFEAMSSHKSKFGSTLGKYHYIWSKGNEQVSCVELLPPWYNKYPWETCHPENRYKTVAEARRFIKKYYKKKEQLEHGKF